MSGDVEQRYDALCEKLRKMHSDYKSSIAPLIVERDRLKPVAMAIKRQKKGQEKLKLTFTEQKVYDCLQRGLRQSEVASELRMSATNVRRVRKALSGKLGIDL